MKKTMTAQTGHSSAARTMRTCTITSHRLSTKVSRLSAAGGTSVGSRASRNGNRANVIGMSAGRKKVVVPNMAVQVCNKRSGLRVSANATLNHTSVTRVMTTSCDIQLSGGVGTSARQTAVTMTLIATTR